MQQPQALLGPSLKIKKTHSEKNSLYFRKWNFLTDSNIKKFLIFLGSKKKKTLKKCLLYLGKWKKFIVL